MSDEIAKKTAEDFRLLGGNDTRQRPASPFSKPAADTPPSGGAAAFEAALERALERVLARSPAGGMPAAEIVARLDDMKVRSGERDDEMAFELRNGLPGRIRREIHEQLRPTEDRLAAIEQQLAEPARRQGRSMAFGAAVLYAVLTGLIVAGMVIFERPLRYWGQDHVLPLVGIGLPVAERVEPSEKKAPPLGGR